MILGCDETIEEQKTIYEIVLFRLSQEVVVKIKQVYMKNGEA